MRKYSHLSQDERNIMSNMLQGHKVIIGKNGIKAPRGLIASIVNVLKRDKSTIYRELRRNSQNGRYDPNISHLKAEKRRHIKGKPRIPKVVGGLIETHLRSKRSPELISVLLAQERNIRVSVEWIYLYIYKHKLGHLLPHRRRRRRRRSRGGRSLRGQLKNQVSITKRPAVVDERAEVGHWEVDTMELAKGQGFLVVAVERKSRLILADLVRTKHAHVMADALVNMLGAAHKRQRVRTITSDNGKEFAYHEQVVQVVGADGWYFAHPHSPWERGTVENAIGLLRRWYPKGMRYKEAKNIDITKVLIELNTRPRKTLNWRSSLEIFNPTL